MQQSANKNLDKIYSISELYEKYDMFFFDIWGVVLGRGNKSAGYIADLINFLIQRKKICFISNSADSLEKTIDVLKANDIRIEDDRIIVTAGHVTQNVLSSLKKGEAEFGFRIREKKDNVDPIRVFVLDYDGIDWVDNDSNVLVVQDISKAECLIINPHFSLNFELFKKVNNILDEAIKLNLPAICPNPDKHFVTEKSTLFCPGYFAFEYTQKGGDVCMVGKPGKPIFKYAFEKLSIKSNAKVLMVGDTLFTDIKGGKECSIDTALVTTGNTGGRSVGTDNECNQFEAISNLKLICQLNNLFPDYFVFIK